MHLASGWDHLLLIACLVLLTPELLPLLGLLTAFTFGHSLTLALAVLGIVQVPVQIVESLIALSIVLVAAKLALTIRPVSAAPQSPVRWSLCMLIGLLHGLGFAGALNLVGIPAAEIPSALLGFNIGIELGQIALVMIMLITLHGLRPLLKQLPQPVRLLPAYAVGSIASFWFFARLTASTV